MKREKLYVQAGLTGRQTATHARTSETGCVAKDGLRYGNVKNATGRAGASLQKGDAENESGSGGAFELKSDFGESQARINRMKREIGLKKA